MKINNLGKKKSNIILGILAAIVFAQALVIAKLLSDRHEKNYEVNLVAINTKKDSIDYLKMHTDLANVDKAVQNIHKFLLSKNIQDSTISALAKDSISSTIYLAKQSNRYSQYLVDLQNRLQNIPLGLPTDGYISSNFGTRKNPIPPKITAVQQPKPQPEAKAEPKIIEEKDSLGNIIKRTVIEQKPLAKKQNTAAEHSNPPAEADQMQFHKGLDIAVAYGSDVRAAAAGTVIFAGEKGGYGNCVIISHGNGLDTLYGHLSQILVKVNDAVKVNTVIAKSGNTGRSTGPHLHYEVHKDNTPVNPKLFLNF